MKFDGNTIDAAIALQAFQLRLIRLGYEAMLNAPSFIDGGSIGFYVYAPFKLLTPILTVVIRPWEDMKIMSKGENVPDQLEEEFNNWLDKYAIQ